MLAIGAIFLTAASLKGNWALGLFGIGSWYLILAALRWAVYRDPRYEVPAERVSPFFPATLPGWVFAKVLLRAALGAEIRRKPSPMLM